MHTTNGTKTPKGVSGNWGTPQPIFDYLDNIYHFNLDAYASKDSALCDNYIPEEDNAHIVKWGAYVKNSRVIAFCNPPYSQPNIELCLGAARIEARRGNTAVVLIPNQPAKYWKHLVIGQADIITLTLGRIAFLHPITKEPMKANAGGSAIITYYPRNPRQRRIYTETRYVSVDEMMQSCE